MPAENSIELFNCSLCSFCETSLDGLALHIRNHIKPEPCTDRIEIPVSLPSRNAGNGNSIDNICGNSYRQLNGNESTICNETARSSQSSAVTIENERNPSSPRIEVNDPRSVTLHSQLSSTDRQNSPVVPPSCKGNFVHSPIMLEKPQFSRGIPSQTLVRNTTPSAVDQNRPDALPQVTRYIQLHPREHPFMERPFANQYVANINGKPTLVHDLVPIAPSVKNGFQDIQPAPMDMRKNQSREGFYRSMPPSERPNTSQNNITSTQYVPNGNVINRNHSTSNDDSRVRPSLQYEHQSNIHYNYQPRPIVPQDHIRFNPSSDKSVPPKFHNPFYSEVSTQAILSNSKSSSKLGSVKPGQMSETLMKQYQSQVGSVQLSDIKKSHLQSNMGVPNNGTIIVNPDQLLSATGNPNMDQLAGILVVPLKKTCDISCQTDPVTIDTSNESQPAKTTRSVQTETYHPDSSEKLFDKFRVTDDLFECAVCGDEFASEHHLQEHMSQKHTHVCEKCYHSSANISEHNMHITDCGKKDSEIICMECNSTFSSLKKMHQHRSKSHNVRMPFRCGVCNVPFETHEAVMKHISTHDQDMPEFKCRYCVKVFQSAEGLNKHFMRHKDVDVYHECRFCKRTFTTSGLLQDHISYMHVIHETSDKPYKKASCANDSLAQTDTAQNERERNTKRYPLCPHCDLGFKGKECLDRHLDKCSKNKDAGSSVFTCDVCKEFFHSDLQRRDHLKKEHKRNTGFRCTKCFKIYRTWSRLKFHTKQQHIKKCCPDCSMVFTKEHVLRKHQEDMHGKPQGQPGERVYTCSYCNAIRNSLAELMSHRKAMHPELSEMKTGNQSSSAAMIKYVDDMSSDEESLHDKDSSGVDHLDKNGNMKNHACDVCGSKFEDEKRLKNHKGLIHGAKPFRCTICKKSFQYSSQVVWHMRTHRKKNKAAKVSSKLWKSKNSKCVSSTSPFVCQFCGAKFSQEKLLNNHKGSVHKIKLFSCEICNTKYGHSTELLWHLRSCRARFKRKNPGIDLPLKDIKVPRLDDDDDSTIDGDGYVCHVCDNAFTHFEEYQNHMRSHPGEEIPSQNLPGSDDMHEEELTMQNGANLESSATRSPSSSQTIVNGQDAIDLLNIEPEFDHSVGEYVCPVCQKTTRSLSGMKTHYGRVHGVWGKESSHKDSEGISNAVWPCKNCDRQFSALGSLRHHSTLTHGVAVDEDDIDVIRAPEKIVYKENFSCPYCDISFDTSKKIRVHSFKKHGTVLSDEEVFRWKSGGSDYVSSKPQIEKGYIRFKCMKCSIKFSTVKAFRLHSLKSHNQIISKKDLSKCRVRVKSSTSNNSKTKVLDSSYPCDLCGRVFANYRAHFTHYRQAHRRQNGAPVVPKTSKLEISPDQQYEPVEKPVITKTYPDRFQGASPKVSYTSSGEATGTKDTIDCPKCDRSYSQNKSFLTHIETVHRISQDEYSKYWPNGLPTLNRKKVQCPKCHKKCVNLRAMRIHFFQAHGILYRDVQNKNFEVADNSGEEKDAVGETELDDLTYDENELRVVEEDNGPPVCFICGRLFRNKRALMTHENKYHGIRWVGSKRIFPERVRNVPNLPNAVTKSNDRHIPAKVDTSKETSTDNTENPNNSILSDSEVLGNPKFLNNEAYKVSAQFVCPECSAGFPVRRAITTHLCRIHRYRKDDLRAYFAEMAASNTSVQENNSLHDSTVDDIDETNLLETSVDNNITYSDQSDNLEDGSMPDNPIDSEVTLANCQVNLGNDDIPEIPDSDEGNHVSDDSENENCEENVTPETSVGGDTTLDGDTLREESSIIHDILLTNDEATVIGESANGSMILSNNAERQCEDDIEKPSVTRISFSSSPAEIGVRDLPEPSDNDIVFSDDIDILDEHSLPGNSINDNVTLSSDAHIPEEENILERCDAGRNGDSAHINNDVSPIEATTNMDEYNDDIENELGVFSLFSEEYGVEL